MKIRKFQSILSKPKNKLQMEWNPKFQFRQHWYLVYSILVPNSEKFIIRSSNKYLKTSKQANKVKLCFAQEANHAKTHNEFSKLVFSEFTGLNYFTKIYTFICYGLLEKILSNDMKLVIAAATEQLNTSLAIETLNFTESSTSEQDTIEDMMEWHFVEEIEHREVIFDLMIENRNSFFYKVIFMALVLINFIAWPTLGTILAVISRPKNLLSISLYKDFIQFHFWIITKFTKSSIRFCLKKYNPKNEKLPDKYHFLTQKLISLEV